MKLLVTIGIRLFKTIMMLDFVVVIEDNSY